MSETATMTLTEFLTARLDEDEAGSRHDLETQTEAWYADRMLADIEAKRRILELHYPLDGGDPGMHPWTDEATGRTYWPECAECGASRQDRCPTLLTLAAIYRDHPDYDPAWAPTEQERP